MDALPEADPPPLDTAGLEHLLTWVQSGVVSRRQLVELYARDHDIRRMVRRRELTTVYPGVYVNHTGPLTDEQQAWAVVLACWPAALTRESALPGDRLKPPLHVAVDVRRTIQPLPGVVIHRTPDFAGRVLWTKSPPRIAVEHAAIDVASTARDTLDAFQVLARTCQSRETNAARIAATLSARGRVPRKQLLLDLLADLQAGACSVLEREYLKLETSHGLPAAKRQEPTTIAGRRAYRDADYVEYGVFVELDGKIFHDDHDAWEADHERDLETVVEREALTVRLSYGQVFRNGCRTIHRIATLLQRRGWSGDVIPCPACPESR